MFKPPGVHGSHQHEPGRIGKADGGTADRHLAIFQRLAQHLQHVLFKLRQLVEKQYAVVGEGDLARTWHGAAADEAGVGDRVVRVAKRPPCDQGVALR